MWLGWLTDDLERVEPCPVGTGAGPDPSTCRLLVAGPEEGAVLAVLDAAREAFELTTRPGPDPDMALSPEGEYVYAYFREPDRPVWDGCFYVGKGVGTRWTQHVSGRARALTAPPETDKERRIDAWVQEQRSAARVPLRNRDLVRLAEHQLVRLLGRWSGPHAAACAFAAEYVLIRGFLGAYRLTNLTSGNDRSDGVRLLVREAGLDRGLSAHETGWARAVNIFARNPDEEVLNTRVRPLLHLLANEPLLSSLDARLARVGLRPAPIHAFSAPDYPGVPPHFSAEGASDPCVTFLPADDRPFRVQLKLSRSQAATFVNVRPRQDTAAGRALFHRFMSEVRPNGAPLSAHYGGESPLRNPGQPYFKPFAANGSGKADTLFSLREEDGPAETSPNWAPATPPLTLVAALRLFLETFRTGS